MHPTSCDPFDHFWDSTQWTEPVARMTSQRPWPCCVPDGGSTKLEELDGRWKKHRKALAGAGFSYFRLSLHLQNDDFLVMS